MDAEIACCTCQQDVSQLLTLPALEGVDGVPLQQVVDGCVVKACYLIEALLCRVARKEARQQAWRRVGEDVAVCHVQSRLVALDDDTRYHKRGAAKVEEVVGGSHLLHLQDISEDLGKHTLLLVAWLHIFTVGCLDHGGRQRLAVHLLILVERYGVNLHRSSRHHVWRLLREDELAERLDVNLLVADDVGSDVLAAILVVEGLHGSVLDARELTNDSLNLLKLDAEAANLHLSIATPHELYVAVRQVTHNIAGTIDAGILLLRRERILDVSLCSLLRAVQIATAHLRSCHPKLACSTKRQTVELRVNNVKAHVVERLADGNVCLVLLQRIGRRENGTLRGTIAVVHHIVLWRVERRELLATDREVTQRMVIDIRGKLIAHLCRDERVGDVVGVEIVVKVGQVQADVLADYIDCSATSKGRIHVHHAGIEAIAGVRCHMTLRCQPVVTLIPMTEGDEIAVRQLAALRHAGRAGGVQKDEETVGGNRSIRRILSIRKILNFFRQQHFALVLVHNVAQLLISNE